VVGHLEQLVDYEKYRKELGDGVDPYDHPGGHFRTRGPKRALVATRGPTTSGTTAPWCLPARARVAPAGRIPTNYPNAGPRTSNTRWRAQLCAASRW
jgi:hypothetical protein